MANTERVTGPKSGIIPLIAVIALSLMTGGGLYYMHVKTWVHPLEVLSKDVLDGKPVSPAHSALHSTAPATAPTGH